MENDKDLCFNLLNKNILFQLVLDKHDKSKLDKYFSYYIFCFLPVIIYFSYRDNNTIMLYTFTFCFLLLLYSFLKKIIVVKKTLHTLKRNNFSMTKKEYIVKYFSFDLEPYIEKYKLFENIKNIDQPIVLTYKELKKFANEFDIFHERLKFIRAIEKTKK